MPRHGEPAIEARKRLASRLRGFARYGQDAAFLPRFLEALDADYSLASKAAATDGLEELFLEMLARLVSAFGSVSGSRGKRILDLACGSSTSRAPGGREGYSALFEPWLCRILHASGASAVGVDIGDLSGEAFESYRLDLSQAGALDFLPGASFDAVHDGRLFGSPEFTARFADRGSVYRIATEIRRQELRLLKPGGEIIHSDAGELVG
jgi:hypothetical protein